MAHIKVSALVIGSKKMAENDRLLTLLTHDKGIVKAYAKDASKLRNSMVTATELLAYSDMEIFSKGERSFVDQASTNTVFLGLRKDFASFSLAAYFCKLIDELVPELDCEPEYLRLALNTIYLLDKGILPKKQLRAIFELRLLAIAGYMPQLYRCSSCGKSSNKLVRFSPELGGTVCTDCVVGKDISPSVLAAMCHICASDIKKMYTFRVSDTALEELSQHIRAFLLYNVSDISPAMSYYESFENM